MVFLCRRNRMSEGLEEEMRLHIELRAQRLFEQGLSSQEAVYAAQRQFGNKILLKEVSREMWGWISLERLWQDVRYALRTLRDAPVFTATALLSLGLGIGANTAIFTLLYTVLLKPLPVPNPERLVMLGISDSRNAKELNTRFSYPVLEALQARNQVFAGPFTYVSDLLKLDIGGDPEPVKVALVSGNYFPSLEVVAVRGRIFSAADDRKGDPHSVVVISHRLWQQRFGGSADLIGRVIRLNGYPVTVIGIMGSNFFGTQVGIAPDIWIPIRLMDRLSLPGMMLDNRAATWMPAMARLKSGIRREQAETAADTLCHQIIAELYGKDPSAGQLHLVLLPGSQGLSKLQQQFSKPLLVLMVLVSLVLLLACTNVANLLLARAITRQREIGVRLAIGASRGRIIRQLLTESAVVAFAGGVLGIFMALGSTKLLVQILPATRSIAPEIDWRVLGLCFATSAAAGILFGLTPAWQSTKTNFASAIKGDADKSNRSQWLGVRSVLLIGQVAVTVVLLVSASLFVGTLRNLQSSDSGFRRGNVLQFSLNPRQIGSTAAQVHSFYDRLLERLRILPGVRAASFIDSGLLSGHYQSEDIYPPSYQPRPNEDVFSEFNAVAPGFFGTLDIRRLRGRDFGTRDNAASASVAIVNEPYARYFFGTQSPMGQRIGVDGKPDMEIVGVVRATKYQTMRDESPRIVYLPFAQAGFGQATLYVQASVAPLSLVASIRQMVRNLSKDVAVYDVKTLSEQIDESMAQERLTASLSSFFGLFALALAATGLYGTISYNVSRRTREIGIRMALGARRTQVLGPVLRESILLAISGIAFGILGALVATRLIAALLYGISAQSPTALGGAAAIMLGVAALAWSLPAHRASKVDPMVALRYE